MRNTKNDRRSQRTRDLLRSALIELMLEKRYSEITVQDLIDRANVGRSTFYSHFLDKDDLLIGGFNTMIDALSPFNKLQPAAGEPLEQLDLTPLFSHMQEHAQLYRALLHGGGLDLIFSSGQSQLQRQIEAYLAALAPQPALALALIASMMTGAIFNLVTWWLNSANSYTPAQINTIYKQLVLPGVRGSLQL